MSDFSGKNWRVLVGDVRARLAELPAQSVHCCVTSPPYWGLRAYGTEPQVWGGDPKCEHRFEEYQSASLTGGTNQGGKFDRPDGCTHRPVESRTCGACGACGAWRGELGSEPTPELFIEHCVEVFRAVWRVLRDDGTLWVNIGDSYSSHGAGAAGKELAYMEASRARRARRAPENLKPKDLVGIPWMLAFALRADGWYLRSEIIWHKLSPMPESVTDRPTKAHEQIFLFSKSPRYFFDQEAVKEAAVCDRLPGQKVNETQHYGAGNGGNNGLTGLLQRYHNGDAPTTRNIRTVWTLPTIPFAEAHFATFTPALPERCIKAGTSARGCCPACGAPWLRLTARDELPESEEYTGKWSEMDRQSSGRRILLNQKRGRDAGLPHDNPTPPRRTTGWQPSCTCNAGDPTPCTVLDPFSGSGTTGMVATELGRVYVGCELNPEYAAMSPRRIDSWRTRDTDKPAKPLAGQLSMFEESPM